MRRTRPASLSSLPRVAAAAVTLAALLMARGRTVAPWADLKQGAHPPGKTAMTHNDKRWYGKPLAEDERGMCAPPVSNAGG